MKTGCTESRVLNQDTGQALRRTEVVRISTICSDSNEHMQWNHAKSCFSFVRSSHESRSAASQVVKHCACKTPRGDLIYGVNRQHFIQIIEIDLSALCSLIHLLGSAS